MTGVVLKSDPEQGTLGERWYRDLLDLLPAAVYATDTSGRIVYYNAAAVELWGRRPELGKSEFCGSWKLFWPDGTPMRHDECPMAIALKEGRPIRGVDVVAERPDGTRVSFLPYPTPLVDSAANVTGALNMLVDISERKRAEFAGLRLAAIVDCSDDAIVSKDLNGIIQSWNHGAERLFGYEESEAIGKPIMIIIPPERREEEDRILDSISRGERIDHYETVRRRKDGTLVDISLTVSPIKDGADRIIGASKIARDITERKRAQARQELLTREIQHRTKNLFAVVQSVVMRSFSGKSTVGEAEAAVRSRLASLAQAHVMLIDKNWEGAALSELIIAEIRPYGDRVKMNGPEMLLSPVAAQNFALAIHELATNAAKYGALSNRSGWIEISWSASCANGSGRFSFRWQERGGPAVIAPEHKGFGSTVLEIVMGDCCGEKPRFEFASAGLVYELTGPLEGIIGVTHQGFEPKPRESQLPGQAMEIVLNDGGEDRVDDDTSRIGAAQRTVCQPSFDPINEVPERPPLRR